MPPKLEIRALGNLSIELDGKPVSGLPSRAAQALVVYLAIHDRSFPRERLAELLWADRTQEQALTNLRTILTPIRRKLGDFLLITRTSLAFDRETDYWLDTTEIEKRLDRLDLSKAASGLLPAGDADLLEKGLALYQGDFLEGFFLREGPGFEEWALIVRERVRRLASDGLQRLTAHHLAAGNYAPGIESADRLLQIDPFNEAARRMMMWLQARAGRRNAALQTYEALRKNLMHELGVEPSNTTRALYERIQTATLPPPARLPPSPTAFVGREREIADVVSELVSPNTRLITIFGPGGIGKTRLAVEAIRKLLTNRPGLFLHGAFFVPLASVREPHLLASSVASALGLTLRDSSSPQEKLLQHLRDREVLLILDNFEQLLSDVDAEADGRRFLQRVLAKTSAVKLLVTSRRRLNLYEEIVLEIPGLTVPDAEPGKPGRSDAFDLFLRMARQKHPVFNPTEGEIPEIARICQLLHGVPLAIELAADWIRVLSCTQIAAEITRGLEILSSTQHNLPARHRSMQAVFDHSWLGLDSESQQIYSGLSVFSGGFNLASANAVVQAKAQDLLALVDHSLLQRVSAERFEIHELLRQYAEEKLAEDAPRMEAVRAAHAEYFMDLLHQLNPESVREHTGPTWETSTEELSNIRLAWNTAVDFNDLSGLARGLPGLAEHYVLKGPLDEGKRMIQSTLAHLDEVLDSSQEAPKLAPLFQAQLARFEIAKGQYEASIESALAAVQTAQPGAAKNTEALAHLCIGEAHWHQGHYTEAQHKIEQALAIARKAGSRYLEAESLRLLGQTFWPQGNYAQAEQYYRRALDIYRQSGNRHGESMALTYLGILFFEQDSFAEARDFMQQAAAMNYEAGDKLGEGRVLTNLCVVCCFQGDYGAAVSHNERALALLDEVGETTAHIANIRNRGMIQVYLGQFAEAEAAQQRALERFRTIGDRRGMCYALTGLCNLFNQWEKHAEALHYGEQAVKLARELGIDYSVAKALTFWGVGLAGAGRQEEAALAFQEAFELGQLSNRPLLALEPLAGLARIALENGDVAKALSHIRPILAQLQTRAPEGASEPFRIYLTCHHVLKASNDARADNLLQTAYRLLNQQAESIEDADLRAAFVNDVPANRELIAAYQQGTAAPQTNHHA